jgi:hypothetical protein
MGRVAALGCILCQHMGLGATPAEVHHLEEETGAAQRQDDWLTIPLCPRHHRVEYPDSVHALKKDGIYRRYKVTELDLLAMTLELAYGPIQRAA